MNTKLNYNCVITLSKEDSNGVNKKVYVSDSYYEFQEKLLEGNSNFIEVKMVFWDMLKGVSTGRQLSDLVILRTDTINLIQEA